MTSSNDLFNLFSHILDFVIGSLFCFGLGLVFFFLGGGVVFWGQARENTEQ